MDSRVKWERTTNFTGRNGYMKCSGVELMRLNHNNSVMASALTSRGEVGRCDIEIPLEAIPGLIEALQTLSKG